MAVVNAPKGYPIGYGGSKGFPANEPGFGANPLGQLVPSGTGKQIFDTVLDPGAWLTRGTPAFYIPGQVQQYPTTTPEQQQGLNYGMDWLKSNLTPGAFQPSTGRLSPGMTALQNMSLEGISNMASGLVSGTGPEGGAITTGLGALNKMLTQGPQDFEDYYQNAVYGPALQDFNRNILPGIDRKFASTMGGSQRMDAEARAREAFGGQMMSARAQLGFQSEQMMNQNILSALGLLPSVTGARTGLLNQALAAGDIPRQVEQQLTDREMQLYLNKLKTEDTRVQSLLGGGTAQTMENIAFQPQVIPSKPSIFENLLSSI